MPDCAIQRVEARFAAQKAVKRLQHILSGLPVHQPKTCCAQGRAGLEGLVDFVAGKIGGTECNQRLFAWPSYQDDFLLCLQEMGQTGKPQFGNIDFRVACGDLCSQIVYGHTAPCVCFQ